ncbi:MAG: hypothetical protein ACWGNI_00325 [Desulfobacterales bacterium]
MYILIKAKKGKIKTEKRLYECGECPSFATCAWIWNTAFCSRDCIDTLSYGIETTHPTSYNIEIINLKGESMKPSAGLSKKQKSNVVKQAVAGKDIGKPGKNFDKVAAKAAKEYGSAEAGKRVAAASMWKNRKRG